MPSRTEIVLLAETLLSLGAEVRQLRKARGLTLSQLSEASGISVSHLSGIERSAKRPSLDVLEQLATALDVPKDWFFARRPGAGPMERAFVVRAQNRRNLNSLYGQEATELGYADSLLSSSIGGNFYMGLAIYAPHSARPEGYLQKHEGEEHGFILEGELEMRLGEEVITLREGDSYSFDARIPHHARNRTAQICKLVWVVSPVVIPKDVSVKNEPDSEQEEPVARTGKRTRTT